MKAAGSHGQWCETVPAVFWLNDMPRRFRNHFVQSDDATSEVAHCLHVVERNAVSLPLRDGRGAHVEMRRERG